MWDTCLAHETESLYDLSETKCPVSLPLHIRLFPGQCLTDTCPICWMLLVLQVLHTEDASRVTDTRSTYLAVLCEYIISIVDRWSALWCSRMAISAYSYWPIWARQVGCMLQILPIILVPLGCIVQTWRYLSSGPPDILDVSAGILAFITCHFLHFCFYFLFLASLILPPSIITTLSSHSYSHFLHFSL